ncbi:MAG TPA: glycoside hydrolase family 5 protein [Anaerolineales bacterium]|nr:glycoside hydrolase family 5 protein [Anaerolineales bacterium]
MPPTPTPEPTQTPIDPVTLQRGINLGNMLEAPNEGDWGLRVQENYFDLIKEVGFDFVRLPVRWNAHAEEIASYTIDSGFFARVDQVVGWALERDLAIILDFHHYEEIMTDPWSHRERYLSIWEQVARHYREYLPSLLFELLNEPNDQLNASLWNQYLMGSLAIVRETNPTRDVVIGPVSWNAYDRLFTLDVPEDEHLIVTFHYYLPFPFTHQGAEWVGRHHRHGSAPPGMPPAMRRPRSPVTSIRLPVGHGVATYGFCSASSARTQRPIWSLACAGQSTWRAKRSVNDSPGHTGNLPLALGFTIRRGMYGGKNY